MPAAVAPVEERDVGAFARQQFDDRPADAAAAAGHDGDLAGDAGLGKDRAHPEIAKPPSTTSV
jgi:hypothetical protein